MGMSHVDRDPEAAAEKHLAFEGVCVEACPV
jgi:hypothetical protein